MRQDEAERVIKNRSANSDNVIFTDHAWDRVDERDLTRADVSKILQEGYCQTEPERNEEGEWQVIMVARIAGSRDAGAVTVILEGESKLVIRTVQWMDLR